MIIYTSKCKYCGNPKTIDYYPDPNDPRPLPPVAEYLEHICYGCSDKLIGEILMSSNLPKEMGR